MESSKTLAILLCILCLKKAHEYTFRNGIKLMFPDKRISFQMLILFPKHYQVELRHEYDIVVVKM